VIGFEPAIRNVKEITKKKMWELFFFKEINLSMVDGNTHRDNAFHPSFYIDCLITFTKIAIPTLVVEGRWRRLRANAYHT
jgi:hypothetical protein